MPVKPCLVCGQLSPGPRCPTHATPRVQPNRLRRPDYGNAEIVRRREAVNAWRERYGESCPGWAHHPPHPVLPPNILTADHDHPVAAGGAEDGPLAVRCRSCNSARGHRDPARGVGGRK